MLLTAIHAQRGDLAKAAIARTEMLKQQPGATIANNLNLRSSEDPSLRRQLEQHLPAGLRKAGIPERWQRVYPIAEALFARSRSWNFWILPVLVFGIVSKRISRGTL